MKFHAKHVSVGESGDQYFQVSFHSESPSDDDFDPSRPDHPYLIVQRQFEDDDGGVCYIETHDHDAYTGHFRLRLIEFTPTRLAFEIATAKDKYVEVTYELDTKRFGEVQRIVHIVFGVQGRGGDRRVGLPGLMPGEVVPIEASDLSQRRPLVENALADDVRSIVDCTVIWRQPCQPASSV